jgi:hypothetical protein
VVAADSVQAWRRERDAAVLNEQRGAEHVLFSSSGETDDYDATKGGRKRRRRTYAFGLVFHGNAARTSAWFSAGSGATTTAFFYASHPTREPDSDASLRSKERARFAFTASRYAHAQIDHPRHTTHVYCDFEPPSLCRRTGRSRIRRNGAIGAAHTPGTRICVLARGSIRGPSRCEHNNVVSPCSVCHYT